jgi:hypothetical protein
VRRKIAPPAVRLRIGPFPYLYKKTVSTMVRQIVVPEQTRLVIDLPEEYVGQSVEVLAFPLKETAPRPVTPPTDAEKQARIERLEKALEGYTFNSGGYQFNREEANDYD